MTRKGVIQVTSGLIQKQEKALMQETCRMAARWGSECLAYSSVTVFDDVSKR
jgi:hypothetical protein